MKMSYQKIKIVAFVGIKPIRSKNEISNIVLEQVNTCIPEFLHFIPKRITQNSNHKLYGNNGNFT